MPLYKGAHTSCPSRHGLSRNPPQITETQLLLLLFFLNYNNKFKRKEQLFGVRKAICSIRTANQIFQVKQGILPYHFHCIDQELHVQTLLFGSKYSITAAVFSFTFLLIKFFNWFPLALNCVLHSHLLKV